MSDIFNHLQDAYDSAERYFNDGVSTGNSYYKRAKSKYLDIREVLIETEKATLFSTKDGSGKFWVPKSMMVGITGDTVKVYRNFIQEILPVELLGKSYLKKIKTCVKNNVQVYSLEDVKYLLKTIKDLEEKIL